MFLEAYDGEGVLDGRVPLTVVYVGKLDADGDEHGFVGECPANVTPVIDGVHVTAPSGGFMSPTTDEHLQLPHITTAGADLVRVQLGYAMNNLGLPRSRFAY